MGAYPKNLTDLEQWFSSEDVCREYLCLLRWPEGFRCPVCGHGEAWTLKGWLFKCRSCGHKASVTAGTVFEGTRTVTAASFSTGCYRMPFFLTPCATMTYPWRSEDQGQDTTCWGWSSKGDTPISKLFLMTPPMCWASAKNCRSKTILSMRCFLWRCWNMSKIPSNAQRKSPGS